MEIIYENEMCTAITKLRVKRTIVPKYDYDVVSVAIRRLSLYLWKFVTNEILLGRVTIYPSRTQNSPVECLRSRKNISYKVLVQSLLIQL